MNAVSERKLAGTSHRLSLGWDGIGGVVILLLAAVSLRDWVPSSSGTALLLRLLWILLYVAGFAALTVRFGTVWLAWTVRRQPALCILLMVALASCLWSLAPLVSLQKAFSLLGTTLLGVFIGYASPPRRIMRILAWVFTLLIVAGIIAAVVLPAPPIAAVGWRGVMGHKNTFGAAAALAMIFFLVATLRNIVPTWWGATLCTLSIAALIQSRSRTSIAAAAVALALLPYLSIARPAAATLRRLALGLVLCVSVLPLMIGPLGAALGSDNLVNYRTNVWAGVATIMSERPLTGYGYAVVWGRADATPLPHIAITAHPSSSTAHNSILDLASELGVPAAVVACFYLFATIADAGRLFERERSAFSVVALLLLVSLVVMGFAETHLLRIQSMFWIVFVALTVAVKRALERPDGASASADTSA